MSQKKDKDNVSNIGDYRETEFSGRVSTGGDGPGGGNGGDGNFVGNEYVDVKVEAAKSEMSAVMSDFRREVSDQISHLPTKTFWIGSLLGFAALLYAALQISGSQFSSGYAASSAYARQLEEYRQATNVRFDGTDVRLEKIEGLLVEIVERLPDGRQPQGHEPEGHKPDGN